MLAPLDSPGTRSAARPLRIGILTDGLLERDTPAGVEIANGGVGSYIHQLVRHLQQLDDRNAYVLIRYGTGRLDIYHRPGSPTVFIPPWHAGLHGRLSERALLRIAREQALDLVHYPNQFGGAFLPRRVKRVATLHDLTPLLFPKHHPRTRVLAYRFLLRRALRQSTHVIVDAASTRTDLVQRRLARADAVTVVPLAAAPAFRPAPPDPEVARRYDLPRRFVFGVGVLEPRKNYVRLVDAVARVRAAGEDVGLVIAGRDGWHWENPLDAPEHAALRPHARLLRNVPDADLPALYRHAAVFAYPSLYEGFGLPLLEAMASGVPVVTSNVSSMPEVAGDSALLVDPTDTAALAAALHRLLRDATLHARLRSAGLERAAAFSWDRTARETLAVYRRVCGVG